VRVNGRPAVRLTVSFAPAGTVSRTFLAPVTGTFLGADLLRKGASIEVLYDPAEPSNFEPAAW
jgi:hypothetical protein